MKPSMDRALCSLQELAYAQLLSELDRFQRAHSGEQVGVPLQFNERVARCRRKIGRSMAALTMNELSALKIARALYLRMLLSSAPSRLRGWEDKSCPPATPPSHLHEWLSHDLELLELAELEDVMTLVERDAYLHAMPLADACD